MQVGDGVEVARGLLGAVAAIKVGADGGVAGIPGELEDVDDVERGVILKVEGLDWNCPQHITPRYTDAEVRAVIAQYGRWPPKLPGGE